ncbi:hypothetical protein DFJ74DRAFT_693779 [Hyaloraphidium curvatum]|nr:hypothetical protein DFJ74DRAFT_693779 [Hyaloraphidium curvatum]
MFSEGEFRNGDVVSLVCPRGSFYEIYAFGIALCDSEATRFKWLRGPDRMAEPIVGELAAHSDMRAPLQLADLHVDSERDWRELLAYAARAARSSEAPGVREIVPQLAGMPDVPADRAAFLSFLRRGGLTVPHFGDEEDVWNFLATCQPAAALERALGVGGGVLGEIEERERRRRHYEAGYRRMLERLRGDLRAERGPGPDRTGDVVVRAVAGPVRRDRMHVGQDRSYVVNAGGTDVEGNLLLAYLVWARFRKIGAAVPLEVGADPPRTRHAPLNNPGILSRTYLAALGRALGPAPLSSAALSRADAAFSEIAVSQAAGLDTRFDPEDVAGRCHTAELVFRRADDRGNLARVLEARTAELAMWSREAEHWPRPGDRVEIGGIVQGEVLRYVHE